MGHYLLNHAGDVKSQTSKMQMLKTRQHSSSTSNPVIKQAASRLAAHPFEAPFGLRNGHAMTIIGSQWPRRISLQSWPGEARYFRTDLETQVLAHCHWQSNRQARPTIIIVHGLEGSADRPYVTGTAEKALRAGFNVIRQNVRNCGDTEHLTPTLYHSGLTSDLRAMICELIERDGLEQIFVIGFSMGGNQTLKLAGEFGDDAPPQLRGVAAISPAIDLGECSDAIARPPCKIYELRFLRSLKATMRRKAELFPGSCDPNRIDRVRSLREFDDVVTGPCWGFGDADGYYANASSRPLLKRIRVPALLIISQDDPFIPFAPFTDPAMAANPHLWLLAPDHGGHVGFMARQSETARKDDRYWAECRAVEFCRMVSETSML